MRVARFLAVAAALGFLAAPASAQTLRGIRKEFATVGERVIPATVVVRALERKDKRIAGSSGVIIHPDGYILSDADATLTHVTRDGKDGDAVKHHGVDAVVRFPAPDHREFRAVVIQRDAETDTTLLRLIDPPREDLPFVPVGTSDTLEVGAFNIIVGNTFGSGLEGEPALSMGSVSALVRREALGAGKYDLIVTSAAVNPGSNGGPCVDAEGLIVGIVSTFETDANSPFRALGKVTPIDRIRARYSGVEDFEEVFPDPMKRKPRSDEAAVLEEAFSIVARYVYPSLVSIEVDRGDAETSIFMPNRAYQMLKARRRPIPPGMPEKIEIKRYPGPYSGVVLRKDGFVLTCTANLFLFKEIKGITVHLPDGRSLPGEIVARDRYREFALIRVEADDLVPLPRATEDEVEVGRFALAVGNPFGAARQGAPLFTFGVISGVDRLRQEEPDMHAIQTDAGMTDGMVGGALVTLSGRILGLCLLKNPDRYGRNSGIGFAIPMTSVDVTLPRLLRGETVEPGYLGIGQPVVNQDGDLTFTAVGKGGPAEKGGLRPGDVLLEVDGRSAAGFADPSEFIGYIKTREPGVELRLKVLRGKDTRELTIVLGSYPES